MIIIAIIAILLFAVGILAFVVIKSVAQPKKLEFIDKLIKQQKFAAAERIAKSIIAKDSRDFIIILEKPILQTKKTSLRSWNTNWSRRTRFSGKIFQKSISGISFLLFI